MSIIVPVYGVEQYLDKCVSSLLSQTFRDLEIVLVDDGSPDRCGEMCDDYAERDARIRVIHQENRGLAEARNAGLCSARGEFVGFVDSDDWVHRAYVETLLELTETGAQISGCALQWLSSEQEREIKGPAQTRLQTGHEAVIEMIESREAPGFGATVVICGKLYSKGLFDHVAFPAGRLHEDEFTTYKLLLAAGTIARTDAPLYMYRQRPHSIMRSAKSFASRMDAIDAYLERGRVLKAAGIVYDDSLDRSRLFGFFMRANHGYVRMERDMRTKNASRRRTTACQLLRVERIPSRRLAYSLAVVAPYVAAKWFDRRLRSLPESANSANRSTQ